MCRDEAIKGYRIEGAATTTSGAEALVGIFEPWKQNMGRNTPKKGLSDGEKLEIKRFGWRAAVAKHDDRELINIFEITDIPDRAGRSELGDLGELGEILRAS